MELKPKNFPLFSAASLILFLLPPTLLVLSDPIKSENTSPFGFVKQIEGSRKGDKVEGISQLRLYLERFGYLHSKPSGNQLYPSEGNDYFGDEIESAIKAYQFNHNLKVTGVLDVDTVAVMEKPRCGVPDDTTLAKRTFGHPSKHLNIASHYSFFNGEPKWPSSKTQLTYSFAPGTRSDVMDPIAKAFAQWASVTHFTFTLVQDFNNADVKISFQKGDHGDGNPFDGPGGTLAHSFSPTDGRLHYDIDENWVVGAQPGAYDMGTVGLHEIGHILGLQHSTDEGAIMFPTIKAGATKGLNSDDIQGIRVLYNISSTL